jgi:hypothetical protein
VLHSGAWKFNDKTSHLGSCFLVHKALLSERHGGTHPVFDTVIGGMGSHSQPLY